MEEKKGSEGLQTGYVNSSPKNALSVWYMRKQECIWPKYYSLGLRARHLLLFWWSLCPVMIDPAVLTDTDDL